MANARFPWVLFDWGGTLMSEDGPQDVAMAQWTRVSAIPGAEETLSRLAPEHRLAIATNASVSGRAMIALALQRVGLRPYISEIFCFTEIGARKDTAQFWQVVTSRLDVPASDLAMVGDSLEQDVMAPRRLGIFSVWFNQDNRQVAAPPDDVPTIHRLADLVPLVNHGDQTGRQTDA